MPGFVDVLVTIAVVAVVVRQFSAQRISEGGRWWVLPGVLLAMSPREPGTVDPRHAALSVAFLCAEPMVTLVLIADGLSNPEIARRLHISQARVKSHINNLFAKAGARDRAQAVRYAYVRGLAQPSGPVFT